MRLLLSSACIKNASIHKALVDLLGKPIADSNALSIPTATYGHPSAGPDATWRFISGREGQDPHVRAGLEVFGVAGAHRAAQHRRRALGLVGPRDRRAAVAAVYAGFTQGFGFTTVHSVFSIPIGLQEMVLAIWLIAKGFRAPALARVAATGEGAA